MLILKNGNLININNIIALTKNPYNFIVYHNYENLGIKCIGIDIIKQLNSERVIFIKNEKAQNFIPCDIVLNFNLIKLL